MEEDKKKNRIKIETVLFIVLLFFLVLVVYYILQRGVPVSSVTIYETEEACEILGKCDCVYESCKETSFGKSYINCSSGWRCTE